MKRFIIFLLILLVLGGIYFDLSKGTLPKKEGQTTEGPTATSVKETSLPYQEVTVQAGYTVLSIVEHLHEGPVQATIQQIIFDFKELNPGTDPDDIQIGKTYMFPLYE